LGKRIGDVLISDGLLSEKTLARALELQAGMARGTKLGAILLKWDLLGEQDLLRTLAKMHHCPAVDWATLSRADKSVTRLLSGAQARRLAAFPYAVEGKRLRVAFTNPSNIAAVDEVQAITGRRVLVAVTSEVRMNQAHQRFYSVPLSRDMWSVVQKIEARDAATHSVRRTTPPPPPMLAGAVPGGEPEPACSDVWLTEPAAANSKTADFIDSLVPGVDDQVAEDAGVELTAAGEPEAISVNAEPPPDPLADDGPLSSFLEGVIHYYGADSDLHEALAAMEMGPIEDLDPSLLLPREEPSGDSLDETHPSGRYRSRRASGEIAL
jgi:MshEN domain